MSATVLSAWRRYLEVLARHPGVLFLYRQALGGDRRASTAYHLAVEVTDELRVARQAWREAMRVEWAAERSAA